MKRGGRERERELLGHIDSVWGEHWERFLDTIVSALRTLPSYSLVDRKTLREVARPVALAARTVHGGGAVEAVAFQDMKATFRERFQGGTGLVELHLAIDRCGLAGQQALRPIYRSVGAHSSEEGWEITGRAQDRVTELLSRIRAAATGAAFETAANPALDVVAALVERLLDDAEVTPAIHAELAALGCPPDSELALLALRPRRGVAPAALAVAAQRIADKLPHVLVGARRGDRLRCHLVLLVAVHNTTEDWAAQSQAAGAVAAEVGVIVMEAGPCAPEDIHRVYEAEVRPGLAFVGILPRATDPDFRECYELAAAVPASTRAYRYWEKLAPLLKHKLASELIATLHALTAFDKREDAAWACSIAPQTIAHRIETIARLTGLDWNKPAGEQALRVLVIFSWIAALDIAFEDDRWGPKADFDLLDSEAPRRTERRAKSS